MREQGSSPHARGSSLRDVVGGPGVVVVPARAGIFPRPVPVAAAATSRPRTRGDLPRAGSSPSGPAASSPHARGSSPSRRRRAGDGPVVPARAGIFPRQPALPWACPRRPRTRGDLPIHHAGLELLGVSSPHARGSSHRPASRVGRRGVVPARAGIFLEGIDGGSADLGRPRTRGDLPARLSGHEPGPESSPHARGSSPGACGFHPGLWSSPHARGSSRGWCRRVAHNGVVPARAGIFLARSSLGLQCSGRPRTRGDLPVEQAAVSEMIASSPHARGSSRRLHAADLRYGVVPARAGIFPPDAPDPPTR